MRAISVFNLSTKRFGSKERAGAGAGRQQTAVKWGALGWPRVGWGGYVCIYLEVVVYFAHSVCCHMSATCGTRHFLERKPFWRRK